MCVCVCNKWSTFIFTMIDEKLGFCCRFWFRQNRVKRIADALLMINVYKFINTSTI